MKQIFLSDKEWKMLGTLAELYHASYGQVIEYLITDRYSVSDGDKNKKRKKKAWEEFGDSHPGAGVETAWRAGYTSGWMQFQTRHNDNNPYVLPEETADTNVSKKPDSNQSEADRVALLEREVAALKELLSIGREIWSRHENL